MAQDHRADVATLRKQIKAKCPTVKVQMGRGTAWGNVDIWGADYGMFTDQERSSLKEMGFIPGGNCCVIMYAEVGYWIKRLAGTLTEQDIEAQRRRDEYSRWD